MNTIIENADTQRKCYRCQTVKILNKSNFHANKNRPLGFEYKCKQCDRERCNRHVKPYSEFTDKQKENKSKIGKIYSKTNKGKAIYLIKAYKKIDLKKGHDNDIDQKYLLSIIGTPCTYCGFPSTGVDRMDNKKGHIKSNCVPCCKECNIARMDNFSFEETKLLGKCIRKIKLKRVKLN